MKKVAVTAIEFYQFYISYNIKMLVGVKTACRQTPTCSAYAKQAIVRYGVLKGSTKAIKRLAACHPFAA
ncbi:MAG: membrane protein insertion efficiency factor YidD [Candidatus Levybacteria bacterium]|nr:membrane protein insertion efficiency factor YidD [Candidatus Levybacteria bacterium]